MTIAVSTKFGQRLCDAVGVDYDRVVRFTIDVVPGQFKAATVVVEYALTTDQAKAVTSIVGEYDLAQREDAS